MLIIGYGYIGKYIASKYIKKGNKVTAVVTSAEKKSRAYKHKILPICCNLDKQYLPLNSTKDREIFYFAPPPLIGTKDKRMKNFLSGLMNSGKPKRIVYMSTTGVYGDCKGKWVDEKQTLNPQADRAKRRVHAESLLKEYKKKIGFELIILRVAGIYGPERLPLERLQNRTPIISEQDAPWTNRIHSYDLVNICISAMENGKDGEVYNVSDGNPGKMTDYFNKIADLTGLPRPPIISKQESEETLSAALLSYLAESRRLDNKKVLADLKIKLKYPNLRDGLIASLKK